MAYEGSESGRPSISQEAHYRLGHGSSPCQAASRRKTRSASRIGLAQILPVLAGRIENEQNISASRKKKKTSSRLPARVRDRAAAPLAGCACWRTSTYLVHCTREEHMHLLAGKTERSQAGSLLGTLKAGPLSAPHTPHPQHRRRPNLSPSRARPFIRRTLPQSFHPRRHFQISSAP